MKNFCTPKNHICTAKTPADIVSCKHNEYYEIFLPDVGDIAFSCDWWNTGDDTCGSKEAQKEVDEITSDQILKALDDYIMRHEWVKDKESFYYHADNLFYMHYCRLCWLFYDSAKDTCVNECPMFDCHVRNIDTYNIMRNLYDQISIKAVYQKDAEQVALFEQFLAAKEAHVEFLKNAKKKYEGKEAPNAPNNNNT